MKNSIFLGTPVLCNKIRNRLSKSESFRLVKLLKKRLFHLLFTDIVLYFETAVFSSVKCMLLGKRSSKK